MSSAIRNFIVTFLVALLIFAAGSYFIINGVSDFLASQSSESEGESRETSAIEQKETNEEGEIIEPFTGNDDSFSVLLLGSDFQGDVFDDYELEYDGNGFPQKERTVETNAIVILKADRINEEYVFISVPDSLQVTIKGVPTLLRDVYYEYGISFLKQEILALTGIDCDYYAICNIAGFEEIIDSIGGIYYNVPTDMYYVDNKEGLVIDLVKGSQTLNGEEAIKLLRYCSYTDGDISRRSLAVSFAKELFKKLATEENLAVAANLYTDLVSHIETDFSLTALAKHLDIIFEFANFGKKEISYPGTLKYDSAGEEYFEPSLDEALTLLRKYR